MELTRKMDYVVCIDSDGCAMDTMDVKHLRFFGPLAAQEFSIQHVEQFLAEWNRINLFSMTRGINRFKGLLLALQFATAVGETIPDLSAFANWCDQTTSLSNGALEEALEQTDDAVMQHALHWSYAVNSGIEHELVGEDKPFEGVKEALEAISQVAEIAIVSSANSEAVNSEWKRHALMPYVSEFFGQERGSKKQAIAEIIAKGYFANNILMVGDAPGDLQAAVDNGVHFYPILFGKEKASWEELVTVVLPKLVAGEFSTTEDEHYQHIYKQHLEQF